MRVHLVDGTYELFRAFHGAPRAAAEDGREVGAVRALARSLARLVRVDGATHVGVAYDHVIESFRNRLFPGYKTGAGIEPDLLAQFELAERAAHALGFAVWPMVEFEADDALASAAARAARDPRVQQVLLCTPDKDLAQCVAGSRIVLWDRRRDLVLDEDGVRAKFGVPPARIPDWLALVGDAADGLPGLPRWGEKSAAAVLAAHGALEDVPEDPGAWRVAVRGAPALARVLAERRAEALFYRQLATLRTDVPLEEAGVDGWAWRGPREPELARLAVELEDPELPTRLPRAGDPPAAPS